MATSLGELIYTLTLNDSGFQGQLETASTQVKENSTRMSTSNKEVEESSHKAGGAFGSMAGQFVAGAALFTIGTKAMSLVKSTINDGIKAAKDWQTAQAEMRGELIKNNGAAGQNAQSLIDMAEATQKHTGIAREDALAAESAGLVYSNIGSKIYPGFIKAAENVAYIHNNGIIPSAQQTTQTVQVLGRAFNDPTKYLGLLARQGITFTKGQENQIKAMQANNNLQGAQALMLQVLNARYADASGALHTVQGQQKLLHEQINDLIGKALKPLASALQDTIKFLLTHRAALIAVGVAIGGLAVIIVISLVGALAQAAFGFIKTGIEAEKAVIKMVAGAVRTAGAWVTSAATTVANWALAAAKATVSAALTAARWIAAAAVTAAAWLVTNAIMIAGFLLIVAVIAIVVIEVIRHWNTVKQWFGEFIRWLRSIWNDIVGFFRIVIGAIESVFKGIIGFIKKIFQDEWNGMTAIWNGVFNFFRGVVTNIGKALAGVYDTITKPFKRAWQDITGWFDDIFGNNTKAQQSAAQTEQSFRQAASAASTIPGVKLAPIGKRAAGGPVNMMQPYLIGEQGPEIFVPKTSGTVLPNNALKTAGTGSPITGPTYNFSAGSVILNSAEAVKAFFAINNRSTALEMNGISPLAGTTRV